MPLGIRPSRWIFSMELKLHVNGEAAYDIIISRDFAAFDIGDYSGRLCIVTDTNVKECCLDETVAALSPIFSNIDVFTFQAGEDNKNLEVVQDLYEFLIKNHYDRKCMLAALGGGVVGDLTGFAAATYLRGIRFIQLPTSLLACVDSSVGGKTGVDFKGYKNMVGAFKMPSLVYVNAGHLNTLPVREFACGMAEVIKYGFIMDKPFLDLIRDSADALKAGDKDSISVIIARCCRCKKEVVEEDPFEKGRRAILNFGHTIGHAIEKAAGFRLNHGECVSIGMNAALFLSVRNGSISSKERKAGIDLLETFGLPVRVPDEISSDDRFDTGLTVENLIETMRSDKKSVAGNIRFVLLSSIGEAYVCDDLSEDMIREALGEVM